MSFSKSRKFVLGSISEFRYGKMPDKTIVSDKGAYPIFSGYKYNGYYPDYNCEEGRLIVVARGVGGTGDVKITREKCWLTNLAIEFKLDESVADIPFLYFYFLKDTLRHLDSGSAQSQITIDDLKRINIELPPLQAQKRIASILFSIDDKIELNHKTNKTLEAIAQAIYKEWFVNFNFPSATGEMQDSELGPIPKGWRVGKYANELNVVYGKNLPTTNLLLSGYPVFGGNGPIGFYDKYLYEDPQVIVACRGAASGKVNQSLPNSFVTNNSLVFEIPQKSKLKFTYLKQYCLNTDFTSFVSGSAQPQLTIESFKDAFLLVPDEHIIHKFDVLVSPIEKFRRENDIQSNCLSQIRDSLLPKLMNGDIEI